MLFLALSKLGGVRIEGSEVELAGDDKEHGFHGLTVAVFAQPIATTAGWMPSIMHVRRGISFALSQSTIRPPRFSESAFFARPERGWYTKKISAPCTPSTRCSSLRRRPGHFVFRRRSDMFAG
jgi:hypothetical protein